MDMININAIATFGKKVERPFWDFFQNFDAYDTGVYMWSLSNFVQMCGAWKWTEKISIQFRCRTDGTPMSYSTSWLSTDASHW